MKNFLCFLMLLLSLSVRTSGQSCDDLPPQFRSFTTAMKAIQNTTFVLTDELPAGKTNLLLNVAYYSCDKYFGYMVYSTQDLKEYILERVPYKVWSEFKSAEVTTSYFVQNIKGKYQVVPD